MKGTFGLFSIDALTIRRSALKKVDCFFKTHLKLHQDTEFLFRISYYLNLYPGILDKAVAVRGVHENNRITKIDAREIRPASTRVILWEEVNNWAKTESSIPDNVKLHITRVYRSFRIANSHFLKKWGMIVRYLFTDYQSIRSGLYNINFRKDLF
ncbi:hypothetical protein [Chryseobacterium nepalense]|uniref:hypothetical protein n=1 Tax=Chryseobacterium nepalense TaxID=1854498 RepID=UPI002E0EB31A